MKLKYLKPIMPKIKGPLIYLKDGKAYKINIGETVDVPDPIAFGMLEKFGDILEKVEELEAPKPKKKRAKPVPVNKMILEAPENKEL